MTDSTGPLQSLRVIEVGSVVAGPFAGRLLADYGADLIKIESPEVADPMRDWGQLPYKDHRLWWPIHARNKRCITLDLHADRGADLFLGLVETADVVIENFRPGTLERWGLGFDRLSGVNPGLVLARVSGFGQTGPYSDRPGYASVAEAMGGLRALNGYPGGVPPRMGISLGDSLGGLFAVQGILAALYYRDKTGLGQVVDVSLAEACMALLESVIPEFDRLGAIRGPSGTQLSGIAPSNVYATRDGKWVIVAANQDSLFRRLCEVMGRPELATDPRFVDHAARGENQEAIDAVVADWVRERTACDVTEALNDAGVVVGPLYTVDQMVADPHFQFREMFVPHADERIGEDVLGPGIVPKFSRTPGQVRWAGPPRPGTHNLEVFAELGLSEATVAELQSEGVI